jgi:hypothetical protein
MSIEGDGPRNPEGVIWEAEQKKKRQLEELNPGLDDYDKDQQELLQRLEDEAKDPRNRGE